MQSSGIAYASLSVKISSLKPTQSLLCDCNSAQSKSFEVSNRKLVYTVLSVNVICILLVAFNIVMNVYTVLRFWGSGEVWKLVFVSFLLLAQVYFLIKLILLFRTLRKRKKLMDKANDYVFRIFSKN